MQKQKKNKDGISVIAIKSDDHWKVKTCVRKCEMNFFCSITAYYYYSRAVYLKQN